MISSNTSNMSTPLEAAARVCQLIPQSVFRRSIANLPVKRWLLPQLQSCHCYPELVASGDEERSLTFFGLCKLSEAVALQATLYDLIAEVEKWDGPLRWIDVTCAAFDVFVKPSLPRQS